MSTGGAEVLIHLENMKVNVDGRIYENPHVIIVGASHVSGEVSPEAVRLDAKFVGFPKVELVEDAVKINMGGDFEADVSGASLTRVTEREDGYVLEGSKITVRFDVDELTNKVTVKVPRVGALKSDRLLLGLSGEVSVNIIVSPFVVGAVTLSGPTKVRVAVSGDKVGIYTSEEGGEESEVELQKVATGRTSA